MKFYINQYATLPVLAVTPVYDTRIEADNINEMLEKSAITFTMVDSKGKLVVAHKNASLYSNIGCNKNINLDDNYVIYYKFTEKETSKPGVYKGQFKIDFFNDSNSTEVSRGGLILPLKEELEIIINPSNIKTTII